MACLKQFIVSFAAMLLLSVTAFGYPPTYVAESVSGQVLDETTREPLQGVIVVAQWALVEDTAHSDYRGASMAITEVTTDRDGRYFIAGWGPLPRPPQTFLYNQDPLVTLFKNGYAPLQLMNELLSEPSAATVRTSRWNGKTVLLKRSSGTIDDQALQLSYAYNRLREAYVAPRAQQAPWTFFPRLFVALDAERRRLNASGLSPIYRAGIPDTGDLTQEDRRFLKGFER